MTPETLRSLIAGGESLDVEFKGEEKAPTRKEAADLCRIDPSQATRLLDRLVKDERLLRHGQRKGAWYGRGAKI